LKTQYEKVFHIDSDCVIFDDINNIFTNESNIAYYIQKFHNESNKFHMVGSIHTALLNMHFCDKFIELCFDIYKHKTKLYLIYPKIEWHQTNYIPGGICDMTLYYLLYSEKLIENITDLSELLYINNEHIVFDSHIHGGYGFNGENTFQLENGIKKIFQKINDTKNKYYLTENNTLIRAISAHCQGNSKHLLNGNIFK
jgi:hypothetical protein